ncbi:MAG TPA: hypothetical protein VGQ35_17725 [Dongiaceae bacterium]|jgi:hypothetical protein|nr:hypothetical protein [Dongiaceae bacterium]
MNLKHVLIGAIVLAACVLGGLWLFLREVPPSSTLSSFQETCLVGQRRGISGDTRPLDEESEARLLTFCGCVEREVTRRLSQQDIAAIGLEQSSAEVNSKLDAILNLCRARNP